MPSSNLHDTASSGAQLTQTKGVYMGTVTYRKVDVDGIKIFYREAGPKDAQTILLLHGFPTADHMFRDLNRGFPVLYHSLPSRIRRVLLFLATYWPVGILES